MITSEILFLSVCAFFTSALTAVVGAGGGTALIALMLQVLNPADAIPVHGVVQLASNTTRVYLLWNALSWPIIIRFVLLMPLGVALGLLVFQGLPTSAVQLLIGLFVLTAILRQAAGINLVAWFALQPNQGLSGRRLSHS